MNLKQKSASLWRSLTQNGISAIEHSPTYRTRSASEPVQHYQKPGHGLFFCLHERSYFVECKNCRRTLKEATKNERVFLAKVQGDTH